MVSAQQIEKAEQMAKKSSRSLRRYHGSDYPTIKSWYEERGKPVPARKTLSDMGYIADGRVAGWLYFTNSNIALIECIISDPNTVPSSRRASLRKLVGFLIDTALMLGYTNIVGLSSHPSIEKVAKEFGFKKGVLNVYTLSEEEPE